jgi:predicted RNA binding protein YcfA (HicA-like mRNA interferase family)
MTQERGLAHSLRNTSVRNLERALLRDGFLLRRQKGNGRFYAHPDGRLTDIHYHHANDTLPRGTLASVLAATRWTEADARRLGLL